MGIILVQEIRTDWSKVSRGAPGAAKRAAVPRALPLPLHRADRDFYALFEHRVFFSEWEGFRDPGEQVACSEEVGQVIYGCVRLKLEGESLRVVWKYDPGYAGAPSRDGNPKQAFTLRPGQWGRVVYNGRFGEDEGWYYRQTTFNVALAERASACVFTESEPAHVYKQVAELH